MNKFIKYSLSVASATLLFASCSGFLDENPTDLFGDEDAYKNPSLIYINTVANIYAQFGGEGDGASLVGVDRGLYDLNTFSSDEAILPVRGSDWTDGGTWRKLFLHRWSNNEQMFTNTWNYLYKVIGLCNNSIDVLDHYSKEVPGWADELQGYKQEVRAIRGLYYYYLLDMFARVPVVTSSTTQMKDVEQSTRSQVFDFVVSELHDVLPYLPALRSNQEGEYYGRVTKPVVWMLLAKLALNAEVYTDNDWTDATRPDGNSIQFPVDEEKVSAFEAVVRYVDKLEAMGYILENDFSTNFMVKNDVSNENIFTLPMDPTYYKFKTYNILRTLNYMHAESYGWSSWNGASATLTAVSKFGYCDINGNLLNGPIDPRFTSTYFVKDNVLSSDGKPIPVTISGIDITMQYLPHRVKLYFSEKHESVQQDIPGLEEYGTVTGLFDIQLAGARMSKYALDPAAQSGGEKPANDLVIFRFADALLMRAEANMRMNKGDISGDINRVRDRAGATPLATITLDDVLDERLRELAWEGLRRQDQIRFGTFTQARPDRNADTEHELGDGIAFKDEPFRTVFPIDINILALNPKLTQNYGY